MDNHEMGQWHDAILLAAQTRDRTYDALVGERVRVILPYTSKEPGSLVESFGLQGQRNVHPEDYPTGTWFYYPTYRDDDVTYVRTVDHA